MSVVLHDFPLSSASYRVRIALNLKGIAYEKQNYKLRAGDQRAPSYLAKNPQGLVPALEIDGVMLTQSHAIIDYLDATRPEPRLIPAEPLPRAQAMAIAQTVACDIHPVNNLRVILYLEHVFGADEAARNTWYQHWITEGFVAIEKTLAARPETAFALGDTPGIVDVFLVPQVFNARRFKVDIDRFPRVVGTADRALALPAFADAAPEMPT